MIRIRWQAVTLVLFAAAASQAAPQDAGEKVLTKTVIVTGVGVDPEKAELAAVLEAVHQVVGLYVEGKQKVTNDSLHEEILTFANGTIYSAERTKDPEKHPDGLWRVEMKISVAVTELKELLKRKNFKMADVPGEELAERNEVEARRKEFQQELDKKASLSLLALLEQFSLADMITPADEPRWKDAGEGAIEVSFRFQPDMERWMAYRRRLELAVRKSAGDVRPILFTVGPLTAAGKGSAYSEKSRGFDFMGQLNGKSAKSKESKRLVAFVQANPEQRHYLGVLKTLRGGADPKMKMEFGWAVYPVPAQVIEGLEESRVRPVRFVVSLLDEAGEVLADAEAPLEEAMYLKSSKNRLLFHRDTSVSGASLVLAAPFPWIDHLHGFAVVSPVPYTVRLTVDPEDVARVAKVVVHVE